MSEVYEVAVEGFAPRMVEYLASAAEHLYLLAIPNPEERAYWDDAIDEGGEFAGLAAAGHAGEPADRQLYFALMELDGEPVVREHDYDVPAGRSSVVREFRLRHGLMPAWSIQKALYDFAIKPGDIDVARSSLEMAIGKGLPDLSAMDDEALCELLFECRASSYVFGYAFHETLFPHRSGNGVAQSMRDLVSVAGQAFEESARKLGPETRPPRP
jgi:hypothetical protein